MDEATIDVAKCINLHNQIVAHGARGLAKTNRHVATHRDWFTYFGDEAEALRDTLSEELIRFLEGIDIVDRDVVGFTPHLQGIVKPLEVWGYNDAGAPLFGDGDYEDCVVLYQSTDIEGDGRGLVLNMDNHWVSFFETILDDPSSSDLERPWVPLEDALEKYMSMIMCGKFVIDPELMGELEWGWRMVDYIPVDVDAAVGMWDDYLDTIIERLPDEASSSTSSPQTEEIRGWVSKASLDQWQIGGFTREFLLRARVPPPIKYVAPGLDILNEDILAAVGATIRERRDIGCDGKVSDPPILLFPSDARMEEYAKGSRRWLQSSILDDRAGLYITPSFHGAVYADAVDMYTPWPVNGSNGGILKYGGHNNPMQTCPFLPGHQVRLYSVLSQWQDFVNDGFWAVGKDGVQGGIEAWKLAAMNKRPDMFELDHICL